MTVNRVFPADLWKETRALLPVWLGCVVIVWAGGLNQPFLFRSGFVVYLLGSAVLGALAVGHEYTNGTLPMLLAAPISRRRMFALKATVLLPMLIALATIALVRLPSVPAGREMRDTTLVGLLSLLSSAFLAPWLTMVCRNVIAGAIFSLSIPAALLVGSELLALAVTGQVDAPASLAFRMQFLWTSAVLLSVVGAVSSWRTFMRLEASDGPRSELRLPRLGGRVAAGASASERSRPIHPVWSLLRKEIHLQQLTFVTSGLYICAWMATLVGRRLAGIQDVDDALLLLTIVHGGIVALLAGSLASAEERQIGVFESQLLIPISTARQWAIKVAVVFGLCVVLTMALPAALTWGFEGLHAVRSNAPFAAVVILLAAVGLYVSSLSGSGVKALLLAAPGALSLIVLIPLLGDVVLWAARHVRIRPNTHVFGLEPAAVIAFIVFIFLIGFGLPNARTCDRSSTRIWRQLLWLCGTVICIMFIALIAP